jgi:hypothetical protein
MKADRRGKTIWWAIPQLRLMPEWEAIAIE